MESVYCNKCSHFKNCKSPCYPVELYLKENNLTVFEKTAINSKGEKISIVFARSREMQQSMLSVGVDDSGDSRLSNKEQQAGAPWQFRQKNHLEYGTEKNIGNDPAH